MEAISHEYPKPRREFGIHPQFSDSQTLQQSIDKNPEDDKLWDKKLVTTVELDCIPTYSQHAANTEQYVQVPKSQGFTDGAWPPEVKTNEFADRQRLLRRIKSDAEYTSAFVSLVKTAEVAISQNNTIDLYEDYFMEDEFEFESEPPSCKTIGVFKDPNDVKRAANKICWHPDSPHKMAISYSILQFQQMPEKMPMSSYIWDVNQPNAPEAELTAQSPLTACVYNPRSSDHILGGMYNGLLGFWDLRKGSSPVAMTDVKDSHHDPVYDVFWTQSRAGYDCCSLSTDGKILWWDARKLTEGPVDCMVLENPDTPMVYGGTTMDYKSDAGATRYLMGTEQGVCLLIDRKAKKDAESTKSIKAMYGLKEGRHHGPIYSIQRNPSNPKYFLTVGDWTSRIWFEDIKSPIITTCYDDAYLTAACWSPTRPGIFFTTKTNGTVDVWDLFYKQSDPIFSTKVGEAGITTIAVQQQGKHIALGAEDGSTTVIEISESLYKPQPDEKNVLAALFERETKREKNLELRAIQKKRDAREAEKQKPVEAFNAEDDEDEETKAMLKKVEDDFFAMVQAFEQQETAEPAAETAAEGGETAGEGGEGAAEGAAEEGEPAAEGEEGEGGEAAE